MQLQYTSSYFAANFGFMDISATLATVEAQGTIRLIFSARDANNLASISLGAAGGVVMGDIGWTRQTGPEFAVQQTSSLSRLFNNSDFNGPMSSALLNANGTLGAANVVSVTNAANLINVTAMQVLEFVGGDLAAASQQSLPGIKLFQLSDQGTLTQIAQIQDTAKTYLDGVTDTAVLQRGGHQLLLTISALENGISSYMIAPSGVVTWIDSIGADNGLPVSGLSMLQTATIGGADFAILAATLSSSLTVLRVNPMGVFFQTDAVMDDLDTRFDAIAAFDTFVAQGRLFVVAAGRDAGLSLFELLPTGRLSHLETFNLEGGQGLQAVSAIAADVIGTSVAILMVDARADRILQYDLAINTLGARIDAVAGSAIGDGLDNRIMGSAGNDTLQGGGGADWIHDGAGADMLTGGTGADVFVMARDGTIDQIMDFTDGQDRIDVSEWGRIYSTQSLSITPTSTGASISYGNEQLIVTSASGTTLSQLTDADFIF